MQPDLSYKRAYRYLKQHRKNICEPPVYSLTLVKKALNHRLMILTSGSYQVLRSYHDKSTLAILLCRRHRLFPYVWRILLFTLLFIGFCLYMNVLYTHTHRAESQSRPITYVWLDKKAGEVEHKPISNFTFVRNLMLSLPLETQRELQGEAFEGAFPVTPLMRNQLTHEGWLDYLLTQKYNDTSIKKRLRALSKQTRQRYPSVLIVGCKSCGTGAISNGLGLHSSISMYMKEHIFFNSDEKFEKGMKHYRKGMPLSFPDQITVDKTPSYWKPYESIKRISEFNPKMKLIIVLSNPVSRIMSDFAHEQQFGKVGNVSFEKFLLEESRDSSGQPRILRTSFYDFHVKPIFDYFNTSQVLILKTEDLRMNPTGVFRVVEDFVGIPHEIENYKVSIGPEGHYCYHDHEDLMGLYCLPHLKKPPTVHPEVLAEIKNIIRPHLRNFYKIVGQDFGWDV